MNIMTGNKNIFSWANYESLIRFEIFNKLTHISLFAADPHVNSITVVPWREHCHYGHEGAVVEANRFRVEVRALPVEPPGTHLDRNKNKTFRGKSKQYNTTYMYCTYSTYIFSYLYANRRLRRG